MVSNSLIFEMFTTDQMDFLHWIFEMAPLWSSRLLCRRSFELPHENFMTEVGGRSVAHGFESNCSYMLILRAEKGKELRKECSNFPTSEQFRSGIRALCKS